MKYLIIGAGAIGTYIGCSLLKTGKPVVFLEREELIQVIKKDGLKLQQEDSEFIRKDIEVYSDIDLATSSSVDVVIFAMKSFDTESAARMLADYKDRFKVVLCLQNGVENESTIAHHIGNEMVIGGSITSAIERVDIGSAKLERKRGIGIADSHPLSAEINRDFKEAGLNSKLYPELSDMKWSKMCSNLLGNATSAILNMTPAEVFNDPEVYYIEYLQMKEAFEVMENINVKVVNLPGVPMDLLLKVMLSLPLSISRRLLKKAIGSGRGGKMPSFHIDLHSGQKKMESTFLNGAVSRIGKSVNVSTPVNDILDQTIQNLAKDHALILEYDHNKSRLVNEIHTYSSVKKDN